MGCRLSWLMDWRNVSTSEYDCGKTSEEVALLRLQLRKMRSYWDLWFRLFSRSHPALTVALTGLDFSLTAIAAVLMLVGYSVNHKVVVYDRMRENLRGLRKRKLREVIDLSINQTLTRSLHTSVTAFLAVLPLAIWGGTAVASFAAPMAVSRVIAACSSIFIAAPILLVLGNWRGRRGITMFATETVDPSEHASTRRS